MNARHGFVAIDFEGQKAHVAGFGATPKSAVMDARSASAVPKDAPLTTVPSTEGAIEAVKRLGGNADKNKAVMLVLITRAELEALELQRRLTSRLAA